MDNKQKVKKYYKEWTAGDKFFFGKEHEWNGDMVLGFATFILNEEMKKEPLVHFE